MTMKQLTLFSLARLGVGLLGFSAVVTEVATLVERGTFRWYNFFSYFTIESNILVALFLILYAALGRSANVRSNVTLQLVRGALTLYILMTGIIFALLLSGVPGLILTAVPWDNIVLHYIIPIVAVIDWVVDPPRVKLPWKKVLLWLIYPLAYVSWALIRGTMDGWYPYPFLNAEANGYPQVLITVVILSAGVLLGSWAIRSLARQHS